VYGFKITISINNINNKFLDSVITTTMLYQTYHVINVIYSPASYHENEMIQIRMVYYKCKFVHIWTTWNCNRFTILNFLFISTNTEHCGIVVLIYVPYLEDLMFKSQPRNQLLGWFLLFLSFTKCMLEYTTFLQMYNSWSTHYSLQYRSGERAAGCSYLPIPKVILKWLKLAYEL
jgi:hypothetical protein